MILGHQAVLSEFKNILATPHPNPTTVNLKGPHLPLKMVPPCGKGLDNSVDS